MSRFLCTAVTRTCYIPTLFVNLQCHQCHQQNLLCEWVRSIVCSVNILERVKTWFATVGTLWGPQTIPKLVSNSNNCFVLEIRTYYNYSASTGVPCMTLLTCWDCMPADRAGLELPKEEKGAPCIRSGLGFGLSPRPIAYSITGRN